VDQRYYKRKNTVEKRVIEKAAMRKKSHKLSDLILKKETEMNRQHPMPKYTWRLNLFIR